jgi:pimeloyl-ACP methyl ester carboxylesterase
VQFDLPGHGQSGGPRAGCTTADAVAAWRDTLAFAADELGTPLYVVGVGEDGVAGYYAAANRPGVAAISMHTLYEYGEPDAVAWFGPKWLIRLATWCLAIGARIAPAASVRASSMISYRDIFGGPGDDEHVARLADDPLALGRAQLRMAYSLVRRHRPPVPFELCRTPTQVIASTANRIWPFEMVRRGYERLGGPKELVTLEGQPQWSFSRDFQERYAEHVIRWFCRNRAVNPARSTS